jgi:hypothetical protein
MYSGIEGGSTYLDKDALVVASGVTWHCYYRMSVMIE